MISREVPITVAVRVRPPLSNEPDRRCVQINRHDSLHQDSATNFDSASSKAQLIIFPSRSTSNVVEKHGTKIFTFDHIFGTDSSQHDVYTSCVQPLLAQLLEGFNATVLAYGQTGSGKTYTIGTHPYILTSNRSGGTPSNYVGQHEKDVEKDMGIGPRFVRELFEAINSKCQSNPEVKFSVSISYLEIYQEHIRDLLGASQNSNKERELSIREDKNGVITTTGLTEKVCHNAEEVLQLLARGSVNRTTHSTRLNNTSSRSHAVFTITLRQEIRDSGVANGSQIFIKTSKMRIVDLAGSERAKRTGNEGVRFKEGVKINSSLLALGNVISILGSQDPSHLDADSSKLNAADKHIPYRDSKLTRILQDSLGGNSKTVLIGCISPNESNYAESLNTLSYANRAKNIKNKLHAEVQIQQISKRIPDAHDESTTEIVAPAATVENQGMQDQSNAQDEHSSMCAAPSSKRDPGVTTSTLKTELASAQTSLLRLTQQIESLELSSTITDPMGTYSADVISTLTDFVLCVLNPRKTAISKSSFEKLMQESRFTNIKPLLQPMISQLMDRDSEVADSTPVFSSEAGNKSESACHLPAINASKSILLSRSPDLLASNINSPTDSTLNTELKKSISEIKKIRQMSRTKSTKCLNTASSARSLGTIQMSVSVQTENADKTVNNADIESQMRDLRHTIDNLNIERESLKHSMSKLESYSNGLKAIIEEGKKKIQALELAKTARDKEIELLADELGKLRIVQREHSDARKNMLSLKEQISRYESQMNELFTSQSEREKEIKKTLSQKYAAKIKRIQEQYEETTSKLSKVSEEHTTLQQQLNESKDSCTSLQSEIENLRKKLNQQESHFLSSPKQSSETIDQVNIISSLTSELDYYRSQNATLKTKLRQFVNNHKELTSALEKERQANSDLRKQMIGRDGQNGKEIERNDSAKDVSELNQS